MSDAPDYYRLVEWAAQRSGVIDERDWQTKEGKDKVWSSYSTGLTDGEGKVLLKSYTVPSGKKLYLSDKVLWTDTSGRYVIKRIVQGVVQELFHLFVPADRTIVIPFSIPLRFDEGETLELYYYGPINTTVTICYCITSWEV